MNGKKDSNNVTKELLEELLEDDHCLVHLNTKFSGMILPESTKNDMTLTLKLSHHFAGAVVLRDTYIEAELRFGSFPFQCIIPYQGVWAVTSLMGHHTIWDERAANPALPLLLKASSNQSTDESATAKTTEISKDSAAEGSKKERPSFLRRVK